jgi:hypothetical protein
MLAGPAEADLPPHDEETGEVIDGTTNNDSAAADHVAAETKGAEASASSKAASAPDAAKTEKKANPKPDKQTPSAEDRRRAILADLVKQGDERAANGPRDLEEWLDGLTGDETALLSHAQVKAWKNEAARAGQ